ncbi:hypothetical protein BFC17_19560 [Alteromonas lipolytica]|uniref:Solute-binding protein family 3/N-terminal domain-containing protein n=2 Tax=Alteromonas lipolytica TaxID=1856405 RepID=A0A1E8FCX0_9ALTE|nr:hypothetical protein BFC17_19560 [Alteromonas lipolytica]
MKAFSILFWLIPSIFTSLSAQAVPEQVIFTRAFADEHYDYYHAQILQRALQLTPEFGEAEAMPHPHPMSQARQIMKLKSGEGQVMWSATSDEREKQLLPVRFPLLQGLAGYRVLVIHKYKQANYPREISLEQLQSFLGVQGADWPDLNVLQYNGFKVEGEPWSLWFTSMFIAVQRGLVDYFPRNVIEVTKDLERHADKNIRLEDNLMLHYPNYEYFFVSPEYPQLVRRIETGLLRMLQNGELKEYFYKHENHRRAMSLVTDKSRKVFELDNPALTITFAEPLWAIDPGPMEKYLIDKLGKEAVTPGS